MLRKSIFISLHFLLIGMSGIAAQDRPITRPEFWKYMGRSEQLTKHIPFRERVTFEIGESRLGPWNPDTSYVSETILPDRHHIVYAGSPHKESIQIGKTYFSRLDDGLWSSREPVPPGVSHPASVAASRESDCRVRSEGTETVVTCLSAINLKVEKGREPTNTFWFDERGILFKHESIVFNSRNWSRRIVLYEYDPSISIQPPTSNL